MKELKSEVSGFVVSLEAKAGDEIAAGQVVLLVESMKMEVPVEAQMAGTLEEILVGEGDSVAEGDVVAHVREA